MNKIVVIFFFVIIALNLFSQKPTCIQGVSGNSGVNDFAVLYFSPFVDCEFNSNKWQRLKKDGDYFIEKLDIDTFKIAKISTFSGSQTIFITPGDSVFFEVDTIIFPNSKGRKSTYFKFIGKNAVHYNYAHQSFVAYSSIPFFREGDNIIIYKEALDKKMKQKNDFLEKYRQENAVSEAFYNYAKADILNDYIFNLYAPVITKRISKDHLPVGYFDKNLRPENELSERYASAVLFRYIETYSDNIYQDLNAIYNYIKTDFSGNEREYLISALIGFFAGKQMSDYQTQLMEIIQEAPQYVKNSLYLDYIDRAKMYYSLVNNPFPEEIKSSTSLQGYGEDKIVSLNEILQKYKGQPVFIDFWASWCGPCIGDIENSQKAKDYLQEKGVAYIYISQDKDEKAWRKKAEQLHVTKNQYILHNPQKSPVINFLKISAIPRYVILDANHIIVDGNAPRPVPESFNEFANSIDKCFKKTVTFY